MGLFPLVRGLPVTFTHQLDKQRRILKHTQGIIEGWTLHAEDVERVKNSTDAELMLTRQPLKIYVRKKDAEDMQQHFNLPPNVYAVAPKGENWSLDMSKNSLAATLRFPATP